jgi:hypothetical protein
MPATHDGLLWRVNWSVHKFTDPGDKISRALKAGAPVSRFQHAWAEVPIVREGNLLMYGGASCMWQCLIGNGTTTAGQALTYFSNARAAIGSGDSTTAAAATQTDLQASTNLLRVAMDATYPTHTDATTSGAATITFRSTFGTSQGNWAWQEWAVFNSATAATGRMLNRRVESLGTKTSAATWTFTVTITLA